MTLTDIRQMYNDGTIVEARIVHDFLSAGWSINFMDKEGNEIPLTDSYGYQASYDSAKQAGDVVGHIGDCPISVDSLFHFSQR